MSRALKGWLAASLLANLMFGGMMMGHFSHRWRPGMVTAVQETLEASRLPQARQEELQARLAAVREQSGAARREARAAREALLEILAAPVFDEAAYDAQVEHLHALRGQQRRQMAETIKEMARALSPPERAALADTLRRALKKKRCDS